MKPTIKDVAKLAGVSIKTVSNVLNNNTERFSETTRDRVLDAIAKLNYQPNRAAQYMRSGAIQVIALAISNIANPYFSDIAREIINAASDYGYNVLIEHTAGLAANERLLMSPASPHTVDGLILDPVALTEAELHDIRAIIPVVLIGERATGQYFDHIMIDNIAASRQITTHLLELGRRRIALLPVVPDKPNSLYHMRQQGYLQALEAAGVPFDPRLVVTLEGPIGLGHRDGMAATEQLLARDIPFDAIFCLNDRVALGAMKTLKRHSYRIPDDVAIVGFDDIEEGFVASPSVTTISPDKTALGQLAVSLLIARIKGERTGPAEQFRPNFKLLVRESTAGEEVS